MRRCVRCKKIELNPLNFKIKVKKYTKKKKSIKLTLSLSNAAGSSYPRTISQNHITEEALK